MDSERTRDLDADERLQSELDELIRLVRSALAQGVAKEDLLNVVFDAIHDRGIHDPVAAAVRVIIAAEISGELDPDDAGQGSSG